MKEGFLILAVLCFLITLSLLCVILEKNICRRICIICVNILFYPRETPRHRLNGDTEDGIHRTPPETTPWEITPLSVNIVVDAQPPYESDGGPSLQSGMISTFQTEELLPDYNSVVWKDSRNISWSMEVRQSCTQWPTMWAHRSMPNPQHNNIMFNIYPDLSNPCFFNPCASQSEHIFWYLLTSYSIYNDSVMRMFHNPDTFKGVRHSGHALPRRIP